MKNNMFNLCGSSVAQIGFYLMQIDETQFINSETHKDIINFMSQMTLYLTSLCYGNNISTTTTATINSSNKKTFLSKKEVLREFSPLITSYCLTQAINKKEIVYSRVGNKYYFEYDNVLLWINSKKMTNNNNEAFKFV